MDRLRWLGRGAFVLGIFAVIALSVAPATTLQSAPWWMMFWDKAQHFLAYAALGGAGGVGFGRDRTSRIGVLVGLIALGIALEIVQHFLPTRAFEVRDLIANTSGAVAGLAVSIVSIRWLAR